MPGRHEDQRDHAACAHCASRGKRTCDCPPPLTVGSVSFGPAFEMPADARSVGALTREYDDRAALRLLPVTRKGLLPFDTTTPALETTRVRRATPLDLADCVRMAVRFAHESPYRALLTVNVAQLERLIGFLFDHGGAYVAQDACGHVVGMVGASIAPHVMNGELVASECAWWVDPEHRGGTLALRLLTAIEGWARENGAVRIQLVAPVGDSRVRDFYLRRGYVELETIYQKAVA